MLHRIAPLLFFPLMLALLLAGLLAGLARLGWPLPAPVTALAGLHGPLMICGVFGTLIGIERAAAGPRWGYAAPGLSAAGAIGLIVGIPASGWLFAGAALVQLALVQLALVQPAPEAGAGPMPRLIQILGLLCWLTGTLLWQLGSPLPLVALCWAGLLLFTIIGGRMSKSLASGQGATLLAAACSYAAGIGLALGWPETGLRLAGLGLLGCALWLLGHDPACRRRPGSEPAPGSGLLRLCLLCGYAWLGLGGLLLLQGPAALTGFGYDMTLHSLFVGFVFSLVLGHLPLLLAQLLPRPTGPVSHPVLYLPVLALQLSLLSRLAGGLLAEAPLRAWGGLLNVAALLAYLLLLLWLWRKSNSARSRP